MVTNKEKNFISAVVYVYNNEDTVEYFLKQIDDALSKNFEKYEIICVNDASTDSSAAKIKAFAQRAVGPVISIINMSYYQGLEMSMNAGVDLAIGDFVCEFDSTCLDYETDVIMEVYNHRLKGFDIVSAVNNTKMRRSSKLFYKLFNSHSNNSYKLNTETFRILSRRAINRIQSMSKTIPYRKAVYANCGLKIDSVIYKATRSVEYKRTKPMNNSRKNLAVDSLILFTDIAYRFSIFITAIFLFTVVAVAVYTVLIFLNGNPVAGWTTTMLFMAFAFFGIFAFFAIIIKYLSLLIDLVFKTQKYTIESVEKLAK